MDVEGLKERLGPGSEVEQSGHNDCVHEYTGRTNVGKGEGWRGVRGRPEELYV